MEILDRHVAFVNEQIEFHKKRIKWLKADSPKSAKKHEETAQQFKELLEYLESTRSLAASTPKNRPKHLRLSLTPTDIEGLPEELMNELSVSSADKTEYAILNLMEKAGGIMSLDQIIVGLYRTTQEIHKRQTTTSRLYRMAGKNLVFSVPNKKGVYSLEPISEEEAATLLDNSH